MMKPPSLLLCMALLVWQAGAQQAPADSSKTADNQPAAYVGSEVCQACHEDIFNAIRKSPHQVVESDKKRGWDDKACESCHGAGSKHAESGSAEEIRNPAKLAPAEVDKICLKCHLNQPTHVGRIQSSHAKSQIACTSCHSIHAHGPMGLVARNSAAVNELCASCHTSV